MDQQHRIEYMRLSDIQRAPRNPKKHDKDGIGLSLDKFGIAEVPALDERTGRLVAGHGRLEVLQEVAARGAQPPKGVQVADDGEWLVPVLRGWASENDHAAEAYLAASNQLTLNGGWDDDGLAELLADVAGADFDLAVAAGFDAAGLEELLAAEQDEPIVHDEVPATSAEYAETAEQEQARQEQLAQQTPRYAQGLVEMILIYTEDDRAEAGRLIAAAREVLGGDLKASEVVLRALRTLAVVLDNRHVEHVNLATVAKAAGLVGEE